MSQKTRIRLSPNRLQSNIRINADDFGISPGVNQAIENMFQAGKLNSASLITGCGYFAQAIEIAKKNPELQVGLHFNLTTGSSAAGNCELLCDANKKFKNGFVKILIAAVFRKKILAVIKNELEAQIMLLKQNGINPTHIDGHRHIHYIPGVFKLVMEAAKKHQIEKIRIINENIFYSFALENKNFLWNGGAVKWLVLRILGLINGSKKFKTNCYFFSILNTCAISKKLISEIKIPKNFAELEIMIHPGNPAIDQEFRDLEERDHLLSKMRITEQL